jgi:glycosyltransferase involved in cell wall biosynthesis
MSTYNGEKYIGEQLRSISEQKHVDVSLWISDDGSNPSFIDYIISETKKINLKLEGVLEGPKEGYSQNFISLVMNENIKADFYAFSDQDDIWMSDKLITAIRVITKFNQEIPVLYCGRTILVDDEGAPTKKSKKVTGAVSFQNALVENIAGGNTMVFNSTARNLMIAAGRQNVISHDWWAYLLITGAGGHIYYDQNPKVYYRQHGDNLIGSNNGIVNKINRVFWVFAGRFKFWNEKNIFALNKSKALLEEENIKSLCLFMLAREKKGVRAISLLVRSGVRRQRVIESLLLYIAAFFGRI